MDTELKKNLSIGSLNVRGIQNEDERKTLVKDALKYKLDIITLAETHIEDQHLLDEIKGKNKDGKIEEYLLFSTNKKNHHIHGTGILIRKNLNPDIQRVSDRICTAEITLKNYKAKIISVYAHTLKIAEENTEIREEFYETIENIIDKTPKRDVIILAGDFNAKTGSGWKEYKENMGRHGKGLINSSGKRLLEMCKKNNLFITNTTFKHKKNTSRLGQLLTENLKPTMERTDEIL